VPVSRSALLAGLLTCLLVLLVAPTAEARGASGWYPFAPYVDMADYPPPTLSDFRDEAGVESVSLGFVTAERGSRCRPTWGGYADYPAFGKGAYQRRQIKAFRRHGDVVISFGGAAGTELASACGSARALAAAYAKAIDAYGADHVDFDVEGATIDDGAANTRRAKAIAKLQHRRPGLRVAYTLPVLPSGLDGPAKAVARNAVAHRVRISLVNGMAMDYGEEAAPDPQGRMGDLAIEVANGMAGQLAGLLDLSRAKAMRRVGITPMIGINDVPAEVFTLDDAHKLADFASEANLGMLGMWQLARDRECDEPTTETQLDCSGVAQQPWDFSRALGEFTG
jgi:hypothetical protein